jgi:hypothetical protein
VADEARHLWLEAGKIARTVVRRVVGTKPAPKKDLPSPVVVIQGYSVLALQALTIASRHHPRARSQPCIEAAKEKQ